VNPGQSRAARRNDPATIGVNSLRESFARGDDSSAYVNGLPLVFIELKNSNVKLKNAFDDNVTNYKREIPQLFLERFLPTLERDRDQGR
jgi:Type I restriction enzyme R protein N terminus (HSDR_N)